MSPATAPRYFHGLPLPYIHSPRPGSLCHISNTPTLITFLPLKSQSPLLKEAKGKLQLVMGERKALVVGLSGCSSSGKTTLARLLRDIFPSTFILHEDDFYKPEDEYVPCA